MSGLVLLRPGWLAALPAVAILAFLVWRRREGGAWHRLIDPALLAALDRLGALNRGGLDRAPFAACAAAALLVLALAGPAVPREEATHLERQDPIVLLLDLSPSVVAGPGLADLQAAAARVLALANGRPVGIMVYAADAYVASAPTNDAASLQGLIAVLGSDTMPVGGSRPDIALAEARTLFAGDQASGPAGADLLIISDGAAADRALDEARRLRAEGARVSTLALGRNAAGAPPPDPAALRALAAMGGGTFAPARTPDPVLEAVGAARIARLAEGPEAARVLHDLGPWLLALALLPAASLFRRTR